MQTIPNFIVFFMIFTLLSLITLPQFPLANANPKGNGSDYHALMAFKDEIIDDPNSILSTWNNSLHFCRWRGVTCGHRHKRVVSLDVSEGMMVGTLSPFIGNLSFLHELYLSNNSFRGHIPHQISHLSRLRVLFLGSNSFEGEIPANLSRCFNLSMIYLSHNKLVGKIPTELASLPNLAYFGLADNNLIGHIGAIGIGNMTTSLQTLALYQNHLQGSIPNDIGRLKGLVKLAIGGNMLSGTIPPSFFNLSNLQGLDLGNTKIHGHLPRDLGLYLPQLNILQISNTSLSGQVPSSLSNLSELVSLDISYNSFKGRFSFNGNNMPFLSFINIQFAFALGGESRDLSFVDTLTNCTNLHGLLIGGNSFEGTFPPSILNFSTSLTSLGLYGNRISGKLPFGLGKFVNLIHLDFGDNHFIGPIPIDIGNLKSLVQAYFSYNNFSDEIPSSVGNLTLLSFLTMENNNFEGSLPKTLGQCQNLQKLYFFSNKLGGLLPVELFRASSLIELLIGQNNFQGPLPAEINNLKNLDWLDISENRFSGEIPKTLGSCISLTQLDMNQNSFVGSIPEFLSPLKSIQELDLSSNRFSGPIPSYFSNWPYLSSLNLSFNNLEGEVPIDGIFANTSVVSVNGNNKLCGGVQGLHLPKCPPRREPKRRKLSLEVILIISIVCVLIVVLSVASCLYFLCSSRKGRNIPSGLIQTIKPLLEVSYHELARATDVFSLSNLLGVGGFGSVYKGILLQDGKEKVVAVKVMNFKTEGAGKSFIVECKALRNIRHRNLVKIITVCSSIDIQRNDFKALVYEFMPSGSLESWLHSSNLVIGKLFGDKQYCSLSLFQRLSIAIDVASAIEYLHTGCATPIIHCDLKPSNILLDDEMTAHVGDFGLAKFLSGASTSNTMNQSSSTQVRGTIGYAAPEYGLGSKVSLEGDIYSFGIIVLEVMTSKKPIDPMFKDGLNLHDFAKSALPGRVMEVIDQGMIGDANLLYARTAADIKKLECIKSLITIGVQCSLELPQDRMSINDVVNRLKSAMQSLTSTSH